MTIVIGGGTAGLQATRDLTHAGLHVILFETRDRSRQMHLDDKLRTLVSAE